MQAQYNFKSDNFIYFLFGNVSQLFFTKGEVSGEGNLFYQSEHKSKLNKRET